MPMLRDAFWPPARAHLNPLKYQRNMLAVIGGLTRNDSGQAHFTVKMPVRKEGGRSARLPIYTDTPIQINS
jgi:hypothetical protein